jgi:hypothetical protein
MGLSAIERYRTKQVGENFKTGALNHSATLPTVETVELF